LHIWINDDKVIYLAKKGIDAKEYLYSALDDKYQALKREDEKAKEAA